jgi:hypothetical protein
MKFHQLYPEKTETERTGENARSVDLQKGEKKHANRMNLQLNFSANCRKESDKELKREYRPIRKCTVCEALMQESW